MIGRYETPEMKKLWSEERKLELWVDIEHAVINALVDIGVAPEEVRPVAWAKPLLSTFLANCRLREVEVGHDVAAFVDVLTDRTFPEEIRPWIHRGLTSSDVVDTALGVTLRDSVSLQIRAAAGLCRSLSDLSVRIPPGTQLLGRTHGQAAEPVTWAEKVDQWLSAVERLSHRLRQVRSEVAAGKIAGPMGNYRSVDPMVEVKVCEKLGLDTATGTQVIPRDRHASYLFMCGLVGAVVESIALQIRLLAQTEIGEVAEGFGLFQKGSSSMPHKRNPIGSEQLCGLARVLRANVGVGLENVALWGERDISHSSAERIVLADSSHLAHYSLVKLAGVVGRLEVFPQRMAENLRRHGQDSQAEMNRLIEAGWSRDHAYRQVQRRAIGEG